MAFRAHLAFAGNCREAFTRYQEIFGGDLVLLTTADAPGDAPPPLHGTGAPAIVHAALRFGDALLTGADDPSGGFDRNVKGMYVNWSAPNAAGATRVFEALSIDGEVQMPLGQAFFSPAFGMCTDRFGTPWIVSLLEEPYPYFDHLRLTGPVTPLPHHGVVAISGLEEASDVYRDVETFSSCNSVIGPLATFPKPLVGDDVSPIIERYRHELPMNGHMVTMDPPQHTQERALLMRLITPKRLKQNEDCMWRLADRQLDEFLEDGRCEFISAYSQPYAMLAVADLLGVPESEHQRFREGFGLKASSGELGGAEGRGPNSLGWLYDYFATSVDDRRRHPREDVLTDLAVAAYPDGSTPDVTAVVRTATFLFSAGQETTARLLAIAMRYLCEYPQLQDELREHRERIPDFIEETLRIESPVKSDFRLARRGATVGGVEIPAGTTVMLLNAAANRDPRRFECPGDFRLDRGNTLEHIAFGRGAHACPGAPLARAEGRISFERILDRMRSIRLSEEHHGPATARRFEYEPTWVLRGLRQVHIEFTPADDKPRRATLR